MSKFKEYDVEEIDALCSLGRALSSPIRIEIMQLLYEEGMIIGDIAKKLDRPASSTAFHLKILEEAGLIRMEKQPDGYNPERKSSSLTKTLAKAL